MKKCMVLASVAGLAGMAMGVSSGIVGYKNHTAEADGLGSGGYFFSVGVCFENPESEDGSWTLADKVFGADKVDGDQIYTFDPDMWNINQFDATSSGWYASYADGTSEMIASISVPKGGYVWAIPAEGTMKQAGKVAALGTQTVTFDLDNDDNIYMFPIVNPFPISTTWGDIKTFAGDGDQVITFVPDEWNINQFDYASTGWYAQYADGSTEMITDMETVALKDGDSALFIPQATTTWTVTLNAE